jgi:hypothetical protein
MHGPYWSAICGKKKGTTAGAEPDAYKHVEKSHFHVRSVRRKRKQIVSKVRRATRDALSVLIMENVA